MAELEIHHEGHESDPTGQRIGVVASLIAVLLAGVTIQSHRSHTSAVVFKTEANDQWAYYQAKSIKKADLGIGKDLARLTGTDKGAELAARYESEQSRYDKEIEEIQTAMHSTDALEGTSAILTASTSGPINAAASLVCSGVRPATHTTGNRA
jgi:hypothetical protein